MRQLRVLLADDHPIFLDGLRLLLPEQGCEVVGEAADGSAVLALITQTRPDAVLLDVQMPRMSGLQCLAAIRERHPGLKVVMLSGIDDPEIVAAALEGGADAYVLKAGCVLDQLAGFLLQLARGAEMFHERLFALPPTSALDFLAPRGGTGERAGGRGGLTPNRRNVSPSRQLAGAPPARS